MIGTPIPKKELDKAVRVLCKRIGALLVTTMAELDADFAFMAMRLGWDTKAVRQKVHALLEGKQLSLDDISCLFISLGVTLKFSLRDKEET